MEIDPRLPSTPNLSPFPTQFYIRIRELEDSGLFEIAEDDDRLFPTPTTAIITDDMAAPDVSNEQAAFAGAVGGGGENGSVAGGVAATWTYSRERSYSMTKPVLF